jgi:hypothetical protein
MPKIQGEGDDVSGRKHQEADRRLAKEGPVDKTGCKAEDVRRRERNLDEGLDETFPASDPVSISPGCD